MLTLPSGQRLVGFAGIVLISAEVINQLHSLLEVALLLLVLLGVPEQVLDPLGLVGDSCGIVPPAQRFALGEVVDYVALICFQVLEMQTRS